MSENSKLEEIPNDWFMIEAKWMEAMEDFCLIELNKQKRTTLMRKRSHFL